MKIRSRNRRYSAVPARVFPASGFRSAPWAFSYLNKTRVRPGLISSPYALVSGERRSRYMSQNGSGVCSYY